MTSSPASPSGRTGKADCGKASCFEFDKASPYDEQLPQAPHKDKLVGSNRETQCGATGRSRLAAVPRKIVERILAFVGQVALRPSPLREKDVVTREGALESAKCENVAGVLKEAVHAQGSSARCACRHSRARR
eukprot:TRINITY_DN7633_c0_g2_i3.p1 TRINITY_DN7633_c0_g2~~TRINITY_DN7633_c0_g2_i3.p1  ORF type:complete len:133 (-),score=20.70 TRINITY_DN7633_c0_g2_i3:87-485(-)